MAGGRGGPMEKKITVFSNDPENPQLTLTIGCETVMEASVEPRRINFGQIGKGEKATQNFSVIIHDPDNIKVTGVEVEDERFGIKHVEGEPSGSGRYELSFAGQKEVGRIHTVLTVKCEGASTPELKVPIHGEVVGDLVYNRSLFFSKRNDAFPEREIAFTSRSGKAVKLTRVEDPDGKLVTEIRYEDGGKKAVLVARVADQEASHAKPTRHRLVIHTSDKDEPTVEIPYTIGDRGRGRGPLAPAARGKRPPPAGQVSLDMDALKEIKTE